MWICLTLTIKTIEGHLWHHFSNLFFSRVSSIVDFEMFAGIHMGTSRTEILRIWISPTQKLSFYIHIKLIKLTKTPVQKEDKNFFVEFLSTWTRDHTKTEYSPTEWKLEAKKIPISCYRFIGYTCPSRQLHIQG